MNTLTVLSPGLLTTVQDLGRDGFGSIGVSASGAADGVSLRTGNKLIGNPEGVAALEMTLLGGTFQFSQDAIIAVTGSDFDATVDERRISLYSSIPVSKGQSLRFGPTKSGARCYLCVRGGIAVPEFLGSRSTHLLSGLGGFEGRALRKGDVLPVGEAANTMRPQKIAEQWLEAFSPKKTIRVTEGPQWSSFSDEVRKSFFARPYLVTEEANRMGIRLRGSQTPLPSAGEMITEGVSLGAIQLPSGGQPIILFVEQQTTGGYPIIANVIAADLASLGQLRPRDEIRFELVSMEEARKLFCEQERILAAPEFIES
jgi:antagonist of KipI